MDRLGGSDNTVVEASLAIFDAYANAQDERPILSVRSARRAAELYAVLEWPLLEAQALELAGEIPAAIDMFAKCGAHADVVRLRRAHTHIEIVGSVQRFSRSVSEKLQRFSSAAAPDKEIASMLSLE